MRPNAEELRELVKRVVEASHPLRIILFGSAVRREMNEGSDIDLLVIMPEGTPRRKVAERLHMSLFGFPHPVDFVIATPELLEKHKQNAGLIYQTILREGEELYAA